MTDERFYVEIVVLRRDDNAPGLEGVIDRRGPFSEWKANKVDDGLNINLNHDVYYTRVVEED